MKYKILVWLVTLVKFRYKYCSQRRAFPLPCRQRAGMEGLNDIRTEISSKNIQLLHSHTTTYRKKLEEVVFVEEGFLYKKISKKDVYMDYGATADIPQDGVKQHGDLTALKQMKQIIIIFM